jgi:hypothetical protein
MKSNSGMMKNKWIAIDGGKWKTKEIPTNDAA